MEDIATPENELFIYPNPAHDAFYVDPEKSLRKQAVLNIFTMSSKLLFSKVFTISEEIYRIEIPATAEQLLVVEMILDGQVKTCGLVID